MWGEQKEVGTISSVFVFTLKIHLKSFLFLNHSPVITPYVFHLLTYPNRVENWIDKLFNDLIIRGIVIKSLVKKTGGSDYLALKKSLNPSAASCVNLASAQVTLA